MTLSPKQDNKNDGKCRLICMKFTNHRRCLFYLRVTRVDSMECDQNASELLYWNFSSFTLHTLQNPKNLQHFAPHIQIINRYQQMPLGS